MNNNVSVESNKASRTLLRVLLIDDDPIFCRILTAAASHMGVTVTTCASPEDVAKLATWNFDVGLFDFNLGHVSPVTGLELAASLSRVSAGMTMILISHSSVAEEKRRHPSLDRFVSKIVGPSAILIAAMHAARSQKPVPQDLSKIAS